MRSRSSIVAASLLVSTVLGLLTAPHAGASTITVGGACGLVNAIRAANTNTAQGGCPAGDPNFSVRDTVLLEPGATYTFTTPYAPETGPSPEATALPHLSSVITIEGRGAVIERSSAPGTPLFRLLRVYNGNAIVKGLTLRGGDQTGGGVGGAIFSSASFLTLDDVVVEDSRASNGAGIGNATPLTIDHSTIRRNVATEGYGGGIFTNSELVIRDSSIEDNTVSGDFSGGGIYSQLVSTQSPLTVVRSTISGNTAGRGAGLGTNGPVTIANSTISGNRATTSFFGEYGGAGIFASDSGASQVRVIHSTIAANATDHPNETGGIFAQGATVRLRNSIVVGNTSGGSATSPAADCKASFNSGGSVVSDGNNVFANGTGCGMTGSDRGVFALDAFTTVLRPLAVNPPGNLRTHRLWKLSPAIDAGDNGACAAAPILGVDQRGVARPDGAACDAGAYEVQRADLALTGPGDLGRPALGATVTIPLTIRNGGPANASGVVVRVPMPPGLTLVSAGSGYDPGTGLWSVGALPSGATASLTIVVRVGHAAILDAEVSALDQDDPDSTPANGARGEDDFVHVPLTPPGIWVNTTVESVDDDGRCNIVEAVFAAQSDTAPHATRGECSAGSGADTVHLQPSAKYISTDIWLSGDAFPTITTPITIDGNGASIERGVTQKYFRAFEVANGGSLTLRNVDLHFFEVRDGGCGGAVMVDHANLTLDTVFASQNRVRDGHFGGGALCNDGGRVELTASRIEDNTVDVSGDSQHARGGGISALGAGVTRLTNSSVRNNVVTSGLYAAGGGINVAGGELRITGGSIRENRIVLVGLTSHAYGGGINAELDELDVEDAALPLVEVTGTTISENRVDAPEGQPTARGGGVALQRGSATLNDTTVGGASEALGNVADDSGGGIFVGELADLAITGGAVAQNLALGSFGGGGVDNLGTAALDNVEVAGNRAFLSGGGVLTGGDLTVENTRFRSNAARNGGGILVFGKDAVIRRTEFTDNFGACRGGAIQKDGGTLDLADSTLLRNSAVQGGGLWSWNGGSFSDLVVKDNVAKADNGGCAVTAEEAGAGIYAGGGALTVEDSEIAGNNALGGRKGGGIFSAGHLTVKGTTLSRNSARFGGGLHAMSDLDVQYTSISLNQALSGGGLYLEGTDSFVASTTIDGNRASSEGGGLFLNGGGLTLANSTVSGNIADFAGGVYAYSDERPEAIRLRGATITANEALRTGGIFFASTAGEPSILVSIIAGNRAQTDGAPVDCSTAASDVASEGGNILPDSRTGCRLHITGGDRLVHSAAVHTEVLFPLADNGGATKTHALRPSSLAIDVETDVCLGGDQRDLPRPKDGDSDGKARCDAGAFEQQTPLLLPLRATAVLPSRLRPGGGPQARLVQVVGSGFGFSGASTILVDGQPRKTGWDGPSSLTFDATESDLAGTADIKTLVVRVRRSDGAISNPLALTVAADKIESVQSAAVDAGSSATVSAYPLTFGLGGAVSGTLTNNGGGAATVTTATYFSNPTSGTTFSAGGFVDLQVKGADSSDRLVARFYYPHTVGGDAERQLELRYWDGSAWRPVRSNGGARPTKDTADNPDGTGMGGRFTVTFSNTSTPKITELSGTVLATALDVSAPTTSAALSPPATAGGWHSSDVTITLNASDDDSGVAATEWALGSGAFQPYAGPIVVGAEGPGTIRYRSTDEAGNVEAERAVDVRIDKTAPSATVAALPAETSAPQFVVAWSGTDAWSGVGSYDVFASRDGGPLALWKSGVTDLSGVYTGEVGHTYGFAARATDLAGNAEALPLLAESSTRVVAPPQPKPKPKKRKVTLCHRGRTIKVPKSQVRKHRKHGDKRGACRKHRRKGKGDRPRQTAISDETRVSARSARGPHL